MVAARSVHGALEQSHHLAIPLPNRHIEICKPAAGAQLDRGRRQHIAGHDGRRVPDTVLDADGQSAVGVRRERQSAVGEGEGDAVAADICSSQGRATFVKTDVTSEAAWDHLIATTLATYGRLDILVNNAGISGSSVGDELAVAKWEKLMAVNATSVFLGTTRAASEMAKTGGGSIINISSVPACRAIPTRRKACARASTATGN